MTMSIFDRDLLAVVVPPRTYPYRGQLRIILDTYILIDDRNILELSFEASIDPIINRLSASTL